uniref:Reverse transcriptase zinc-binding domain-containing protein n=1 Tax=Lactuca sativa TaxID=4236 RepID=A0A9R1X9C3_LACSA|nr:hypothetical protein LSAT_V11C500277210 [Lactuca sativa]
MTPFFLLFAYLLGGVESLQWGSFNRLMEYVSLSHASDRGYWNPSGLGEFLVASARSFIDEKTLPSSSTKTKWSKLVPIKVNDFSWRLALGKLSTLHNLLAWDIICSLVAIWLWTFLLRSLDGGGLITVCLLHLKIS